MYGCSAGPRIDVNLGRVGDQLHLSSIPDHAVEARTKRTMLVVSEVRYSFDTPRWCSAPSQTQRKR